MQAIEFEKEPVLATPVENIFQTVLYTVAMISYLLMSIFGIYSFFPNEGLKGTPAGEISLLGVVTVVGYLLNFVVLIMGLTLFIMNKLTAKKTGYIMAVPYVITVVTLVFTYIDMQIKKSGNLTFIDFLEEICFPFLFMVCIWVFFCLKEKRMSQYVIYAICVVTFIWIVYALRNSFLYITDLGFVVKTVHSFGKIGLVVLLGYQAYVWNKKRRVALKQ